MSISEVIEKYLKSQEMVFQVYNFLSIYMSLGV